MSEQGPWYTTTKQNDTQGLICDETTGGNIAVSYNPADANMIAAAPELLAALELCLPYVGSSRFTRLTNEIFLQAEYAIKKAKGEIS